MTERTCIIEGCGKPARSAKADWCGMHYHRWYRHGDVHRVAKGIRTSKGRRYTSTIVRGHPLAHADGKVYDHRRVLYDRLGPGTHECFWCGTELGWYPRGTPGSLQTDHLNGDGGDNRSENLVASCGSCNTSRGQQERHDALRRLGWWSSNDTIAQLEDGRAPRVELPHRPS